MSNEEKSLSSELKEHVDFFRSVKEQYRYYNDKLDYCNNLMQDYLHSLELDDLNCKERSKLATKMAKCRKERRVYKDKVQVLEPLMRYIESHYKILIDGMGNIIGDTRKVEMNMKNRIYHKRVLPENKQPITRVTVRDLENGGADIVVDTSKPDLVNKSNNTKSKRNYTKRKK